jgi:hypothetical protein
LRGSAMAGPIAIEGVPRSHPAEPQLAEKPQNKAQLVLTFAPVEIAAEGDLEFATYFNDQAKPAHVHRINVRRGGLN